MKKENCTWRKSSPAAVLLALLCAIANIRAGVPPSIVTPPAPQTVPPGSTVTFNVVATSDAPLFYRWQTNGFTFFAWTNPFVTLSNVQVSVQVSVAISNAFGAVTSAPVSLTVTSAPSAPVFTLQPTNQFVPAGSTATFRTTASGSPAPAYRWFHNGTQIGLTNGAVLTLFGVTPTDAGPYFCTASNASGMATSQVATLTLVTNPPVFTLQPTNQTVPFGGTAQFRVAASGSPVPVYRWFHDGAPFGSNGAVITLSNVTVANAGSYFCIASNASGTATSQTATLTVLVNPPTVGVQPANQTVYFGGSADLYATVSGNPAPTLQWFRNGSAFTTNASSHLAFPQVTAADGGSYFCVASNLGGAATSAVVTLTVLSVPPVLSGPADTNALVGDNLSWGIGIANPPATLRLVFETTNVVQVLGTSNVFEYFSLTNLQTNQSGHYFVLASNQFGMSTSRVATLTVGTTGAPLTNCVIYVPAIDVGNYDGYGDHEALNQDTLTGRFTSYQDGRNPRRSWFAYHIPNFPGTLTNAVMSSYTAVYGGSGTQNFELRQVTTPVATLRRGGFGLTNIFADLADGPLYGAVTLPVSYEFRNLPLNPDFLAAATAARGSDFALGGSVPGLNLNSLTDEGMSMYSAPPYFPRLALQLSVPAAPTIYLQPPGDINPAPSNAASISVGACGAEPLTYYWSVDGVGQYPQSVPNFYMPNLSFTPQSVFVIVSNAFGTATSAVAQVKFGLENLHLNFTSLVARVDDQFYFQLQSDVYPADSVQWLKDGAPIGQTGYYWLLSGAQTNDAGDYRAVVSGSFGSITSAVAHLDVVETPPVIWQNPGSMTVSAGSYVSESVSVAGGPRPALRWYHNGALVPGQTDEWLYFYPISASDAGSYYLTASNRLGVATSSVAFITVTVTPPSFWGQPSDLTVYAGGYASFYMGVNGSTPLTFRWFHNGALLAGADNSTQLYLPGVSPADAGSYFCVVSNSAGSVTSQVATLTVLSSPPVLSGPLDLNVQAGSSLNWYFGLDNPPAFIQWFFEQTNLLFSQSVAYQGQGALYFSSLQTNHSGHYTVIASNQFGMSTSRVATLTVTGAPPGIALYASAYAVIEGVNVYFNASAGGSTPMQISLYHNGVLIPADGIQAWHISSVKVADSGDYTAVASNAFGVATSTVHLSVSRAGPLDQWTIRNPLPQGRDLHSVAWGAGRFVAVGDNGALVTSPDGTNWTAHNVQTSVPLYGVAFGGGRFVATSAGGLGVVLTSTNGERWDSVLVSSNLWVVDVTYGDGHFLAVGNGGTGALTPQAYRSTNGIDWNAVAIPLNNFDTSFGFRSVAYGAGRFVVLDDYGLEYSSPDLLTWTGASSGTNIVQPSGRDIAYVNGGFVALGD